MFPPFNISKKFIGISREPFSGFSFVFWFENGDSYDLNNDEASRYLQLIGIPEELDVLGYVQNFNVAILDIEENRFEGLTKEQLTRIMNRIAEFTKERVSGVHEDENTDCKETSTNREESSLHISTV